MDISPKRRHEDRKVIPLPGTKEEVFLEDCVRCYQPTGVFSNVPISEREHYVRGAGQFHEICFRQDYTLGSTRDSYAAKERKTVLVVDKGILTEEERKHLSSKLYGSGT